MHKVSNSINLRLALVLLIVFALPASVLGKREHPEKWYQEKWCEAHRGQVEVVLTDGTRCDCVTDIIDNISRLLQKWE